MDWVAKYLCSPYLNIHINIWRGLIFPQRINFLRKETSETSSVAKEWTELLFTLLLLMGYKTVELQIISL